jgi:hypothetical protein
VREYFKPQYNAVSGQKMKPLIPILAAFIEPTEMAENTPFLKADRLAAFGAFFAHKAMLGFMTANGFPGKVSILQHPRNGIGDGQHQSAILKDRMLTADPF